MASRKQKLLFLLLLIGVYIVSYLPLVNAPFEWFETFFHEISHGLAAIFTGGSVDKIVLSYNGAGLCYTRGGSSLLVAFSGYAGAALWGAFIFVGATAMGRNASVLSSILLVFVIITGALWARDLGTIIILFIIAAFLGLMIKFTFKHYIPVVTQFIGLYILVSATHAPLYLLSHNGKNDAHALSQITHLPELIWIAVWFVMALGTMWFLWRNFTRKMIT